MQESWATSEEERERKTSWVQSKTEMKEWQARRGRQDLRETEAQETVQSNAVKPPTATSASATPTPPNDDLPSAPLEDPLSLLVDPSLTVHCFPPCPLDVSSTLEGTSVAVAP